MIIEGSGRYLGEISDITTSQSQSQPDIKPHSQRNGRGESNNGNAVGDKKGKWAIIYEKWPKIKG